MLSLSTPWHRFATSMLLLALLTGCATTTRRVATPPSPAAQAAIADFARQLPTGSHVLVERTSGRRVRGTLIKVSVNALTLQPRTRLPEPPVEIALSDVVRLQPQTENGRSLGKAIAIGAAAGAGAALGFFLFLLAALD